MTKVLDIMELVLYYGYVQSFRHTFHRQGGIYLGYKLKERREILKLSQEELASISGISRQTISSLENNSERNVSTRTLARLAAALETTIGALFLMKMSLDFIKKNAAAKRTAAIEVIRASVLRKGVKFRKTSLIIR